MKRKLHRRNIICDRVAHWEYTWRTHIENTHWEHTLRIHIENTDWEHTLITHIENTHWEYTMGTNIKNTHWEHTKYIYRRLIYNRIETYFKEE